MSADSSLLKKGLLVLLSFQGMENGQSVSEISRKMGVPFSTTSRILKALEEESFLERDPENKLYYLGLNCYRLGSFTQEGGLLRRISLPIMEELRGHYQETVILYVRKGDWRVYYAQLEGPQSLRRMVPPGATAPLWVGSASRCLLAYSPQAELERLFENIHPFGPCTITNKGRLMQMVRDIRTTRYDISVSEREEGVCSVSSPILGAPEKVAACLTLTGPALRFKGDVLSSMVKDIKGAAERISRALQEAPLRPAKRQGPSIPAERKTSKGRAPSPVLPGDDS